MQHYTGLHISEGIVKLREGFEWDYNKVWCETILHNLILYKSGALLESALPHLLYTLFSYCCKLDLVPEPPSCHQMHDVPNTQVTHIFIHHIPLLLPHLTSQHKMLLIFYLLHYTLLTVSLLSLSPFHLPVLIHRAAFPPLSIASILLCLSYSYIPSIHLAIPSWSTIHTAFSTLTSFVCFSFPLLYFSPCNPSQHVSYFLQFICQNPLQVYFGLHECLYVYCYTFININSVSGRIKKKLRCIIW